MPQTIHFFYITVEKSHNMNLNILIFPVDNNIG